jgi:hypothetical protein
MDPKVRNSKRNGARGWELILVVAVLAVAYYLLFTRGGGDQGTWPYF